MQFRYYFDYSDYRSYLMMHSLSVLEDLPVEIQWIALDAYSLRALSHFESREDSPNSQEFAKREALRFCKRENIDFVWQNERVYFGSILRAGFWIAQHRPESFQSFSRQLLYRIWGLGQTHPQSVLDAVFKNLDMDFPKLSSEISDREVFQHQDDNLQRALSDGVFDVPTLVMDTELICHFDQAEEMRRIALNTWLRTQNHDILCNLCTRLLSGMNTEDFQKTIAGIMRQIPVNQVASSRDCIQIEYDLPVPADLYPPPKSELTAPLTCHLAQISDFQPDSLNICTNSRTKIMGSSLKLFSEMENLLGVVLTEDHGQKVLQVIQTTSPENPILQTVSRGNPILWLKKSQWNIALLAPESHHQLYLVRMAANRGAHLIICAIDDADFPVEAFGPLAHSWILNLTQPFPVLIGSDARKCILSSDLSLTADTKPETAQRWDFPPPRTLLLCEQPLTLGDVHTQADIELGCRGMNLLVATRQQSSELSKSRAFERLNVNGTPLIILPIFEEQLFNIELISHRMLGMINQTPKESLPILVSYWNAPDFSMLDTIRPVLAATLSIFQIPIVLVIGNQIIEIWCSSKTGNIYCIEKEDDRFTLELGDIPSSGQCFDKICQTLDMTATEYLELLKSIPLAAESAPSL